MLKQSIWNMIHGTPIPPFEGYLTMGMNLPGQIYYESAAIYNDPMKATTQWRTYAPALGGNPTELIDEFELDINGYALNVPVNTSDGQSTVLQIFLNNYRSGRYRVLYDGEGTFGGQMKSDAEGKYIDFSGNGTVVYFDILATSAENHIRNIRLYCDDYASYEDMPKFNETFMRGLTGFGVIRFMDLGNTNKNVLTDTRVIQSYHTQSESNKGMSYEDMCEIANQLQVDAWVCVPSCATNTYIIEMAQVFFDNLDPGLKVYVEYSNELWNWIFDQAHWVANGGIGYNDLPPATDSDVIAEFARIKAQPDTNFPEMGAYMMARTFYYWNEVFATERNRLITVGSGQSAWEDNNKRILAYLWDESPKAYDAKYGAIGCDAYTVGGYFNGITETVSNEWIALGDALTNEAIYQVGLTDALEVYEEAKLNRNHIDYINNKYGTNVNYIIYEGGQHMQPYNQGEWSYNQKLYDFQITPLMYDLYERHFKNLAEPDVNCDLFVAFSYMGKRINRYGSWGHLENLSQIGGETGNDDYMNIAPKFQALLDFKRSK